MTEMMESNSDEGNDVGEGVDLSGDGSFDDFLNGFEGSAGAGELTSGDVQTGDGQPSGQSEPTDEQLSGAPQGGHGGTGPNGQQTQQPPQTQQTQQRPQPGQQTQQQPGQQQPGQEQQTSGQPQPQVSFEQYVEQNKEQLVKHMADNMFQPTKEEREAMGSAADVVPAYMARANLMTMTQIMGAMQKALPGAVAQLVNISQDTMQRENAFYGEYPELKSVDKNVAANLAVTLRRANPQMPQDQFAPLLARTIAAYSGIPLQPQRGQPQPYAPAGGHQGGGAPQQRPQNNGARTVTADPLYDINAALRRGE